MKDVHPVLSFFKINLFDPSRVVAMTTNYRVKMSEIGRLTFIHRLGIPKRSRISQFRFKRFICDDLATLCKYLVTSVQ